MKLTDNRFKDLIAQILLLKIARSYWVVISKSQNSITSCIGIGGCNLDKSLAIVWDIYNEPRYNALPFMFALPKNWDQNQHLIWNAVKSKALDYYHRTNSSGVSVCMWNLKAVYADTDSLCYWAQWKPVCIVMDLPFYTNRTANKQSGRVRSGSYYCAFIGCYPDGTVFH